MYNEHIEYIYVIPCRLQQQLTFSKASPLNTQGAQVSGLGAVSIVGFGVPQWWPGDVGLGFSEAADDLDDTCTITNIYIIHICIVIV